MIIAKYARETFKLLSLL